MWNVSGTEILNLRSPGGDRFTEFVDALIRAEAFLQGVPDSDIATNLRTNRPDGGVDTEVRVSMPSVTGWFDAPTCWQYKATEARQVSTSKLRAEMGKDFVRQLVTRGYAYRLCVCDEIDAWTRNRWEAILLTEARHVNVDAPPPRVASAGAIAAWASRFPAVVNKFFPRADGLHLDNWVKNARADTREFVEVPEWGPIVERLQRHVDLSRQCLDVVLPLRGAAGVGKTRLVAETLSKVPGASGLTISELVNESETLPM